MVNSPSPTWDPIGVDHGQIPRPSHRMAFSSSSAASKASISSWSTSVRRALASTFRLGFKWLRLPVWRLLLRRPSYMGCVVWKPNKSAAAIRREASAAKGSDVERRSHRDQNMQSRLLSRRPPVRVTFKISRCFHPGTHCKYGRSNMGVSFLAHPQKWWCPLGFPSEPQRKAYLKKKRPTCTSRLRPRK